ncbi:rod shape-determining protein [Halolactibacillus alkaliphilus]|uniref:Cell shape-determining protein MreB n=1 Tax=Halolactibacillus alkaliphilus TaxID=442899 RepID=A0A511X243_9BACI|nr:rod shape-determining protein [Halolactibacillus alkaliphilus]GEN57018.1 rod shape-determining protein [Halolactibacillus alkaliphilus]GGN71732.1 rod shape-determining protein [Halolactibacillus alkaliphilus]SFO85260.1 rod shape-determining protein MreB [Halolactibacillus alkaliphilus]
MIQPIQLGIDLGTANTLVYASNKGILYNEPTVISVNRQTNKITAIGHEAKAMIGKTPQHIETIRPLKEGVIADFDLTSQMLKEVLSKVQVQVNQRFRKPHIVICAPSGSTAVEKRAIENAMHSFGVKSVQLIEEPVAAAVGAGLPITEPISSTIVDIGGGTTEVAIISYGGVVTSRSLRTAGDDLDEELIQYVKHTYNILIGEQTAEYIKQTIGYAPGEHDEVSLNIRGRDLLTGLPKSLKLTSTEIQSALSDTLNHIALMIHQTLEASPPELSGDIVDFGITLVGGGALLKGIIPWLENELHVPIHVADEPLLSVAKGTLMSIAQKKHRTKDIPTHQMRKAQTGDQMIDATNENSDKQEEIV